MIFDSATVQMMNEMNLDYKLLIILHALLKHQMLTFNLNNPVQQKTFVFLVEFIKEQDEKLSKESKYKYTGYHIIFGLIAKELVSCAYR